MSKDFRTESKLLMSDLFDGRLSKYGISEDCNELTRSTSRCLTDNDNFIWVFGNAAGRATCISRYGMNSAEHILDAIAQEFDTEIYSEHEPQFWGFSSQEEWHEWQLNPKQFPDDFYESVIQYLSGNGVKYDEGTILRIQLEIAKELSNQNSDLLLPENKEKLLNEIEKIYWERYLNSIQPTGDDLAVLTKSWSENMER